MIASGAGIVPFGGDQAHKGFALALLVELLCTALGGLGGCDGRARDRAVPRPTRCRPCGPTWAGYGCPVRPASARRQAALERGAVELRDELWEWLSAG